MIKKIEAIYLYVNDIQGASHFYETVLGLKPRALGESAVEFDLGGDRLGIRVPPPSIPQGWEGPLIFIEVDDIEITVDRLSELGVKIVGEIATVKDFNNTTMRVATFYDPDGNPLHLVQRSAE